MHCESQYAFERGSRLTELLSWTWSLHFSSKWLEDGISEFVLVH